MAFASGFPTAAKIEIAGSLIAGWAGDFFSSTDVKRQLRLVYFRCHSA
jgi:hypothetical protein